MEWQAAIPAYQGGKKNKHQVSQDGKSKTTNAVIV